MALWGMVFFLLVSCSDNNAPDKTPKGEKGEKGDIENVKMPSSDASAPIISGQMIVIRGAGFNENSKIWLQSSAKTRVSGVQADIISYSDESISFIAPQMSGNCSVVLDQDGNTQELGQVYLEERDLTNLPEYIYAIGYAIGYPQDSNSAVSPEESSSSTRSNKINSQFLYLYDSQNRTLKKTNGLPQGEIIRFALPENDGNGNVYYFKSLQETKQETERVGLYSYNIKSKTEKLVCMDWSNKFTYNKAPGVAIGTIENTLCGVEVSKNKRFEVVSFEDNGETTPLRKAFPYDKIDGKNVSQFYCEDDYLIFTYDKTSRCVLFPGIIRFEGEDVSICVLSLNMRTGDIKVLRGEQDTSYYAILATKQGVVLVEFKEDSKRESDVAEGGDDSENMSMTRSERKTILKLINPETLKTISVLDKVDQEIIAPTYNEKNNSIYWSGDKETSDYVFEYNLDSKQVKVSDNSLPYIETLFSIKY